MRHLIHRALSLGLCGALLAGMLTLGASAADPAALTDAEQINQWQAVATLCRLGVVEGKEGGAFDPGAPVTRAEAAKMLVVLLNGGEIPELHVPEEFIAPDIKGHWAEPYMAYCAMLGILNGRADGAFDPEGQITVAEMAKMCLVALGYDPEVFGLTGQDWAISTNVFANQLGLYEGLINEGGTLSVDLVINRENAVRMLFDLLNAPVMFRVASGVIPSTGEMVYTYSAKDSKGEEKTFFQHYFAGEALPEVPAQPGK